MGRGMLMIYLILWAALATLVCAVMYINNKRKWKAADKLMDDVIANRNVDVSDIEEGDFSLFVNRLIRIQEKIEHEVGNADEEKEQVKQLISNMSHQIKTPIANVMMYTQLLESDDLEQEKRHLFLEKLRIHSEHIDWILNSLFKMTKLEQNVISFDAELCSIKETLRLAVGNVYEKAALKKIDIIVDEFRDIDLFHNRKWTSEVFVNILENAIKYTDENGLIKISTEQFEMYTGISITDNGRGIKEDEIVQVFNRFYRSDEVQNIEGSGIGLYLAKIILEKEKGYITAASDYGKGSSFTVFLRNE